ncbi:MAG: UvrB/UvrC motif-containing protein [Bacteroidota bacterium]
MLCEHCRERQANVHITQVVNDKRVELNLCEACYKKEAGKFNFYAQPDISLPNLLAGFFQAIQPKEAPAPAAGEYCRSCGLSYRDFTKAGQLGCSECYAHFAGHLEPVLRRIHGHTAHIGKVPRRTGGIVRLRKELDGLRQRLQEAVRQEAYEEAARLRDEIHRRESELKKGGNP